MERKLSMPVYAAALFLSIVIFMAGVYLGTVIDRSNLNDISEVVYRVSGQVASVQLLLLMEGNSSSLCPVYLSELKAVDSEVETVGYKLSYLEEEKQVLDNDLKKRYFVLEAESYLLSQKMKALCGDDSVLLIHFYSNRACTGCKEQGTRILKARDELANQGIRLKLFSFDGDLGSPVADAFKSRYNVTGYPSVVVDGVLYSGLQTQERIEGIAKGG